MLARITPAGRAMLFSAALLASSLATVACASRAAITSLHQTLCATAHKNISPTQLSTDLHRLKNSISFMLDLCHHHPHLEQSFILFIKTIINAEHTGTNSEQATALCEESLSRFVLELARTLPVNTANKSIRNHLGIIYGYYTRIPTAQRVHLLPQKKKSDPLLKWLGVGVITSSGILIIASGLYLLLSKNPERQSAAPQPLGSNLDASPVKTAPRTLKRRKSDPNLVPRGASLLPANQKPRAQDDTALLLKSPPVIQRQSGQLNRLSSGQSSLARRRKLTQHVDELSKRANRLTQLSARNANRQ